MKIMLLTIIVMSLLSLIGIIILRLGRNSKLADTICSILWIMSLVLLISIPVQNKPYKINVYSATEYDLNKILEQVEYKVIIEDISEDYVVESYFLGDKEPRYVYHIHNTDNTNKT